MDWIVERLREPSTWGGLASLLTLVGVTVSPEFQDAIIAAGVAIGGALMVFMREKGRG